MKFWPLEKNAVYYNHEINPIEKQQFLLTDA